jgi:hypothetical protein
MKRLITNLSKYHKISYGVYDFEIESDIIEKVNFAYKDETHYKSFQEFEGNSVQIIPISQINHKIRKNNTPLFNDGINEEGEQLTAKERVLNILSGFDNGQKIKPVKLYREDGVDKCVNLFKMAAGCHRLHCSIAYGFSSIPAVICRKEDCIFETTPQQ